MLERIESSIERLIRSVQFGLVARLHPELARLKDDKDRSWALWFAVAEFPAWQRLLHLVIVLLIGPLLTVAALGAFVVGVRSIGKPDWWLALALLWVGGIVTSRIAMEFVRRRHVRPRFIRSLRIFGHDVCPGCCYDMVGHEEDERRERTCPECGACVPSVTPPPAITLDPHAPYMPARWFRERFGISPERLRSARRRDPLALAARKERGRWSYSVPDAQRKWPRDVGNVAMPEPAEEP